MAAAEATAVPAGNAAELPVEGKTIKTLTLLSLKRTHDMYSSNYGESLPMDETSQRLKIAIKVRDEYSSTSHLKAPAPGQKPAAGPAPSPATGPASLKALPGPAAPAAPVVPDVRPESRSGVAKLIDTIPAASTAKPDNSSALVIYNDQAKNQQKAVMDIIKDTGNSSAAVSRRLASKWPRPVWHPPWKMYRVVAGHLGWVRSIAVDPSNEWFATGSADRTIKIWDLATGQLKLTLTGHIEQVTGLAVSSRHPYMFSVGLDKTVKCWDLEQNKVIRNYHGHLSGVYSVALHPTLDVLCTGGRDSVCRVWDIRTKVQIMCLSGHEQTVCSILTQPTEPQVITGSHDSTIRLWDLAAGKTRTTLTYHKKAVRAMAAHPSEYAFASASADNIKKFALPDGVFLHNMLSQQKSIINAMALNQDGVMATGGDNGTMWFWDWTSGHCFQQDEVKVQPGSLDAEAGIYAMSFDNSGSRLITCEADKTIKMWREDERATPQSAPGLTFRPPKDIKRF
mmetsp:Transcript_8983/g.19254  ORF Transcript_8983/g.19254 Transcript_8983/m.19254 type:complete len:509 (-) Transcript_8983:502-2028(-)|eukprot:CAMPEP_0202902252 /NCGR_PEP_ID=MMETSP1392-20130828/16743_1 /ASSEMBLY_ACC=CAM_ASM_000868 /TAXON_ID=225041 /ORGANISM="Chlamydomonas chlamydogama, Strain SAG 11-48b" /LENGTH=508 /DNA_ID=CAMNT_0049588993 /DNA_START=189 /DNA_END=1715 /DNA_ORIENTATION=-